jgi:hypothetical protein
MNRTLAEHKVDELVHLARCWCEANAELRDENSLSPSQSAHLKAYLKYLDAQITTLKRQNLNSTKTPSGRARVIRLNANSSLVAVAK